MLLIKIFAVTYLIIFVIDLLVTPAMFGEERRPYSFGTWIAGIFFITPLILLLAFILTL